MNFADRVRHHSSDFTPAEHRIVQALFSSNMLAGLETGAKLAERAKTSSPTVLRFASKLGYDSFPDFQSALREEIELRLASPLDTYDQRGVGKSDVGLISDAARIFSDAVARTLGRIDPAVFERVSELLADASRPVYVIGGRYTQHLAEMLWGHLHMLRPRAHILRTGVVSPLDHLIDFGRREVLVVFDVRRYQESTVELAEFAKLRRATIILITDPLLSPISRIANHILTCDLDTPSPHDSLVPGLALTEILVAGTTRAAGEPGRQRLIEIEHLRSFGEKGALADLD